MSVFLKTVEAETEQKKYYAYLDSKTQSAVNSTKFTANKKLEAERVYNLINLAFADQYTTYLSYKKTQATIKIEGANQYVFDTNPIIASIVAEWEARGYLFKFSKQGINIGIKK